LSGCRLAAEHRCSGGVPPPDLLSYRRGQDPNGL